MRLSARRFFSSSSTNSTESWSSRIPPRRSSAILEHLCDGADGERTPSSPWLRVARAAPRAEHERRFVRQHESSSPRSPQQLFLCSRFRKMCTASKASHTHAVRHCPARKRVHRSRWCHCQNCAGLFRRVPRPLRRPMRTSLATKVRHSSIIYIRMSGRLPLHLRGAIASPCPPPHHPFFQKWSSPP